LVCLISICSWRFRLCDIPYFTPRYFCEQLFDNILVKDSFEEVLLISSICLSNFMFPFMFSDHRCFALFSSVIIVIFDVAFFNDERGSDGLLIGKNKYYLSLKQKDCLCCSIAAAYCTTGYFVQLLFTYAVWCALLLPYSHTARLLSRWRANGSYP